MSSFLHSEISFFVTGERSIAFAARLSSTSGCFGPFNKNVSISYQNVSLNHGYGYNPAMGEHRISKYTNKI